MFRKSLAAIFAAVAFVASPVAAQDGGSDEALSAFAQMFPAEPLTAEQEARLPVARGVVDKLIPPGTLGEMMGATFDRLLGPIAQLASDNPQGEVARQLGYDADDLGLDAVAANEIAVMLDPVWQERSRLQAAAFPKMMSRMMESMEPTIRSAMSELYAIHFDDTELADIDTFFSTPSGAAFARKSFAMSSDPRLMTATFEAMPAIMGSFAEMQAEMTAATAGLPPPRGLQDLGSAERARLSELSGLSEAELAAGMAAAAGGEEFGEDYRDETE